MAVDAAGGGFAGERPFGRAANARGKWRVHMPTDADMGPHNWGGGEAKPKAKSGAAGSVGKRGRLR